MRTDVADRSSVFAMAAEVVGKLGPVDILYNNAAATRLCNERDRPVHELDEDVWDRMIDVCLKSVYLCSQALLPAIMERRRGVILNTSSVDAVLAEAGCDSYTAAKGGVISITKSMAAYYARFGIRVNALMPGYVITECQIDWYENDPEARAAAEQMHLTRIGRPEDIAEMALYLVSDKAEYITGAVIPVDGGFTAFKAAAQPFDHDR